MGNGKKEATWKEKQGKTGDGMSNVKTKGENFYRTAKQARTLNVFNTGKAQRNASGKVTKAASYQSREKPKARVEPNRFVLSRAICLRRFLSRGGAMCFGLEPLLLTNTTWYIQDLGQMVLTSRYAVGNGSPILA